jgi:hypothetical protein
MTTCSNTPGHARRSTVVLCLCAPLALAQAPFAMSPKLASLIPGLYGPGGLTLPNPDHEAHFDSSFQRNFGPFNIAIASQLSALPLPSSASGFTYTFDPALGVYNRTADSFGPILAERAETLGQGKFYTGFAYQHFKFASLDGVNLHRIPAVFEHLQTTPDPVVRRDIITTSNFLDARIGQFTTFFTYGLLDRLDVSVALPLVSAALDVVSNATVQRIGTAADNTIHYFRDANGNPTDRRPFAASGSASGIGDVLVRFKGAAISGRRARLALGLDVRMPTGDEYDFLGSGAAGLKPFVALSARAGRISPHVNFAYQWNGSSVLAGDIRTGAKGHLPNQLAWAAGFDAGVSRTFTFAFDVLGQRILNAQRLRQTSFTAANGALFPQISFARESLSLTSGSVGFKVAPISTLLVSANFIFQMNHAGLRARVIPLVGVSYAF